MGLFWLCSCPLQGLQPGNSIVLESPQSLYADEADPHLTQGLFMGVINSLGPIKQDSICSFRQVQAEMALAPEPGSLVFYSGITYKRLMKPPKASLQVAEQLYSSSGSEVSTVILTRNRYNLFGGPAAAASRATEAWCVNNDAASQQLLTQLGKQKYLLHCKTKQAAGQTTAAVATETAETTAGPPQVLGLQHHRCLRCKHLKLGTQCHATGQCIPQLSLYLCKPHWKQHNL